MHRAAQDLPLDLHPADAESRGVDTGARVVVHNDRGAFMAEVSQQGIGSGVGRSFDLAISTESAFFSPFDYVHQMILSLEALHSEHSDLVGCAR